MWYSAGNGSPNSHLDRSLVRLSETSLTWNECSNTIRYCIYVQSYCKTYAARMKLRLCLIMSRKYRDTIGDECVNYLLVISVSYDRCLS